MAKSKKKRLPASARANFKRNGSRYKSQCATLLKGTYEGKKYKLVAE